MIRRSTKPPAHGLTMLEIIIVLIVVAAAASLITLRLTSQEDTLFLRRFILTLQRSRIQAMETGATGSVALLKGGAAYVRDTNEEAREIPENVMIWPVGNEDAESSMDQTIAIRFYTDGSARILATDQPEARITDLDVVFNERRIYRVSFHPLDGIRCRRVRSDEEVSS